MQTTLKSTKTEIKKFHHFPKRYFCPKDICSYKHKEECECELDWEFNVKRKYYQNAEHYYGTKPNGFYLSVEEHGNGWSKTEFIDDYSKFVIVSVDISKVLKISSPDDIRLCEYRVYAREEEYEEINWQTAKNNGYTGVLIELYDYNKENGERWFRSWDCDSAVIWNLNAIKRIETTTGEILYKK